MSNSIARTLIRLSFAVTCLAACDSAESKPKSAEAEPKAPASEDAAKPGPDAEAAVPADTPTCAQLAEHVHQVLSTTGSARTKENLPPAEKSQANCEKRTQDPELMRCFMAAKDEAAIDECNLKPFLGKPIDATPTRSFDALKDNSAVEPPMMSEDGDYIAWDEHCGLLFKSMPPAGAVFVACDGKANIGPIVNIDVLDQVMKSISDAERSRHEMVMGIISKMPSGNFSTPYRVYDEQGRYKGIEYR